MGCTPSGTASTRSVRHRLFTAKTLRPNVTKRAVQGGGLHRPGFRELVRDCPGGALDIYAARLPYLESKGCKHGAMIPTLPRAYDLRVNHTTHLGANLAILSCIIGLHDDWHDTVGSAVATCLMLMCVDTPGWHLFSIVQTVIGVAYPHRHCCRYRCSGRWGTRFAAIKQHGAKQQGRRFSTPCPYKPTAQRT